MSKKEIKHINGNNKDSKAMADAKKREPVDVVWEKTPTWTIMTSLGDIGEKSDYFGKIEKDEDK